MKSKISGSVLASALLATLASATTVFAEDKITDGNYIMITPAVELSSTTKGNQTAVGGLLKVKQDFIGGRYDNERTGQLKIDLGVIPSVTNPNSISGKFGINGFGPIDKEGNTLNFGAVNVHADPIVSNVDFFHLGIGKSFGQNKEHNFSVSVAPIGFFSKGNSTPEKNAIVKKSAIDADPGILEKDMNFNGERSAGGYSGGLEARLGMQMGPCELTALAKASLLLNTVTEAHTQPEKVLYSSADGTEKSIEWLRDSDRVKQVSVSKLGEMTEIRVKDGKVVETKTIAPRERQVGPGIYTLAELEMACKLYGHVALNASVYGQYSGYNAKQFMAQGTPVPGDVTRTDAVVGGKIGVGFAF